MTDRIAMITGGSRGLGQSAALHLASHGIGIVLTYRHDRTTAMQTVDEIRRLGVQAIALQLDVTDIRQFPEFAKTLRAQLIRHWQRDTFDFLVNNAGSALYSSFADTTEQQFDEAMNIHFKGVFFLTQSLIPLITDGGRILNVSSGLTRFAHPGHTAYAAMKGAIEVFSRHLALELGPRRITVNVIAPGAVATDFGGGRVRDTPELNAEISAATALGRVARAEDIGGIMAALLSDDMGWINAQRIEASGGMAI